MDSTSRRNRRLGDSSGRTERQSRNSIYFVSGSGLFDRVVGRLGLSVDRTVGNRSWIFRIHSWDINSGKPVRRISVEYLLYARYDRGLVLFEVEKYMKNLTYIIHSGFISGYQNRYGDNLKPPTNVYHRMTA